ncbi:MAG TPA: 1-deoxy-D-xylulose-5-phosphate synthase [Blastocatellia bacterium]|nr:1-deoxy-D-xylulose-5-phosphate synthase [Blastocatellia bacterium]
MENLLSSINSPEDLRRLPVSKLQPLANEVREHIIEVMSKIGGHTGASLGGVELSVALQYAFNTPRDKVVWDVGHQAYGHKVVTGRRDQLHTIRQYEGISGFLKRSESEYDVFGAGHAGTSLSAALGIATARDLNKDDYHVCAVIGDASVINGMAVEALNNLGHMQKRMIIVLNDNEMSISPSLGALTGYLNRIRSGQAYNQFRDEFETTINSFGMFGRLIFKLAKKFKDSFTRMFVPGVLAEELGIRYMGPINGHDCAAIVHALEEAKQLKHPVIIHALTVKGYGYGPAEADPPKWHGTSAFEISTGKFVSSPSKAPSYTGVFANAMVDLMKQDDRIIAITAAMPEGTGIDKVMKEFPSRTFDVGIAEEHGITFCAGMATEGLKPVAAIYSTFLQRAFDQIYHDVCVQHLDVTFALDRAGIVGADGPTHHGLMDFAYMRVLPEMIVMAPKDENEFRHLLKTAIDHKGPATIRYPRGNGIGVPMDKEIQALEIGKAEVIKNGGDIAMLAIGTMVYPAIKAAERLQQEGIQCTVINARFVKPLDTDLILALARTKRYLFTIEEHYLSGGFGSAVMELLESYGILPAHVHRMGVPDEIVTHGAPNLLLAKYGLDADGIYRRVKETITAQDQIAKPIHAL